MLLVKLLGEPSCLECTGLNVRDDYDEVEHFAMIREFLEILGKKEKEKKYTRYFLTSESTIHG